MKCLAERAAVRRLWRGEEGMGEGEAGRGATTATATEAARWRRDRCSRTRRCQAWRLRARRRAARAHDEESFRKFVHRYAPELLRMSDPNRLEL